MPQYPSNYDPATGQYHADPLWRRYQQPPRNPLSSIFPKDIYEGSGVDDTMPTRSPLEGLNRSIWPPNQRPEIGTETQDIRSPYERFNYPRPSDIGPKRTTDIQLQPDRSGMAWPGDIALSPEPRQASPVSPLPSPVAQTSVRGLQTSWPPQQPTDFGSLSRLQPSMGVNDPLELSRLRQERLREFETRTSGDPLTGLRLSTLKTQIAEDPFTGESEQGRIADIETANQEALLKGFTGGGTFSPAQAAGQAAFGLKRTEIESPLNVARLGAESDIAKQREVSRGLLDVERERQKGFEAKYEAIQDMLRSGVVPPGGRVSIPGVASISQPATQRVPAAVMNRLQTARKNYEAGISGAEQELAGAIEGAFYYHPADASLKAFARELASDPETAELPVDEIIATKIEDEAYPERQLSSEEMADIRDLVTIVRGF